MPLPLFHKPAMARSSELLPQPLGPVMRSASPGAMRSDKFCINMRRKSGVYRVSPSMAKVSPARLPIVGEGSVFVTAATPSTAGGSAQGVGAAGVLSTTCESACSRSIPATKRLKLSKLSTMSETAASTAVKAPAAVVKVAERFKQLRRRLAPAVLALGDLARSLGIVREHRRVQRTGQLAGFGHLGEV